MSCPSHPLWLIAIPVSGEEYKLWSSSLCSLILAQCYISSHMTCTPSKSKLHYSVHLATDSNETAKCRILIWMKGRGCCIFLIATDRWRTEVIVEIQENISMSSATTYNQEEDPLSTQKTKLLWSDSAVQCMLSRNLCVDLCWRSPYLKKET
jgi:hypothetical protein